jgi:hypothetical protein
MIRGVAGRQDIRHASLIAAAISAMDETVLQTAASNVCGSPAEAKRPVPADLD